MKASQFFAIAMAAFALLSCAKEEGSSSGEVGQSKLSLRIVGETEAPKGRAAGNPTQTQESTINNFIIFVFKGDTDGTNDVPPTEYPQEPGGEIGKVVDMVITTDAKEVYVVANIAAADTPETHAALKAVKKKSDLQAIIGRGFAAIAATATPTQTSTNLWMSGQNEIAPVENGNVDVTVALKYVAAKVRITSVTVDPAVKGLTLTNITVFNGAAATRLIPGPADGDGKTSLSLIPSYVPAVTAPFYVSGLVMTGMAHKPTIAGKNNEYNYNLTGDLTIGGDKNQQYFYVFENDGEAFEKQPTIITLSGVDAESAAVNYSVFFKADEDGKLGYDNYVIERGKSYDITMNIKKLGNPDPTIPAMKTTVIVTITPAKWDIVEIDKTYE